MNDESHIVTFVLRAGLGILLGQLACWGQQSLCVRYLPVPTYSRLARMARLEGVVNVSVEIGADGTVVNVSSTGAHSLLRHEAEENVRQWTFQCPARDCKFPFTHRITYVYKLAGDNRYEDPPPVVKLTLPDRVEITSHPPTVETQNRSK